MLNVDVLEVFQIKRKEKTKNLSWNSFYGCLSIWWSLSIPFLLSFRFVGHFNRLISSNTCMCAVWLCEDFYWPMYSSEDENWKYVYCYQSNDSRLGRILFGRECEHNLNGKREKKQTIKIIITHFTNCESFNIEHLFLDRKIF